MAAYQYDPIVWKVTLSDGKSQHWIIEANNLRAELKLYHCKMVLFVVARSAYYAFEVCIWNKCGAKLFAENLK